MTAPMRVYKADGWWEWWCTLCPDRSLSVGRNPGAVADGARRHLKLYHPRTKGARHAA